MKNNLESYFKIYLHSAHLEIALKVKLHRKNKRFADFIEVSPAAQTRRETVEWKAQRLLINPVSAKTVTENETVKRKL